MPKHCQVSRFVPCTLSDCAITHVGEGNILSYRYVLIGKSQAGTPSEESDPPQYHGHPRSRVSGENMCADPPLPREVPVTLPIKFGHDSARILAQVRSGCTWFRYAVIMLSPSCMAWADPANTASCPLYKCRNPRIFCWMYKAADMSSNFLQKKHVFVPLEIGRFCYALFRHYVVDVL